MASIIRKCLFLILLAGISQGIVFAADKTTKGSTAPVLNGAAQNSIQQGIEKRGLPPAPAASAPVVPASAAAVPTAAQIYANAPEEVSVTSGGNAANGGHLWNCPKGYSVINAASIPFSESNLRCKKDPFLFSVNQCGNCVHTPNAANPNAGCVRGVSMTCS